MLELDRAADGTPGSSSAHRNPAEHPHIVQFYDDDAFLLDSVAAFLAAGWDAGERLLVIATPEHCRGLRERLEEDGRSVDGGRLLFLDAEQTLARFLVDGMPVWDRFVAEVEARLAQSGGADGGPLRAFGEMVDLLWRDGHGEAVVELEELWNRLGRLHPLSLLCGYRMDRFDDQDHVHHFQRICGAHSRVLPSENYTQVTDLDTRLREVSQLQQRARSLEREIERRKQLEASLRAADRAKDEFIAMLGHELRNPLSPILSALELMALRDGDVAATERAIIQRQVDHLIHIVDELLDVSRITSGKVELALEPLDLSTVVAEALETTAPGFAERGHRVEVSLPEAELPVLGDRHRLGQSVANLLTNAAKYTEPGGRVWVAGAIEDQHAVVRVRDDGVGIAPELLPRLFDTFVQGDQSLDRSHGGLGLGLAIVRSLVSQHGGTISVHSDGVGQGSEFVLRLPLARESPPQPGAGGVAALPRGTRAGRVLVVDDNQDAAALLGELLKASGYAVSLAPDGARALEQSAAFAPEFAILDIGLPGMDGFELATRLRALPGGDAMRLIAVTGYGRDPDRARSVGAGFDAHLVKPISLADLVRALEPTS